MRPASLRIEPERREGYDSLADSFEMNGLDVELFFNNPSYFASDSGRRVELAGSHPTLVHWPLDGYVGGAPLVERLLQETRTVQGIAGSATTTWVDPHHWHSTVFSPVHSSDPRVIAQAHTDIAEIVQGEVDLTTSYTLSFTRILIMPDGGVKAVAYADCDELNSLRRRLQLAAPGGAASGLIHVSLGSFLDAPAPRNLAYLKDYVRQFRTDKKLLGQITIEHLTYAQYTGPFTRMTVRELARHSLRAG